MISGATKPYSEDPRPKIVEAVRDEVEFDWIVTAEQAEIYKPSLNNFEVALERVGVAPDKLLRVAQSLFHDHVPAEGLGRGTVSGSTGVRGRMAAGRRLRRRPSPTSRCRTRRPRSSRRA